MSLTNSLLQGFESYLNSLMHYGSVSQVHIQKLVIASWINKVINGHYGIIPTDEQYHILDILYQCIEGDCLVPYRKYCNDITINKLNSKNYIKITEDNTFDYNIYRVLEEGEENILRTTT